MGSINSSSLRAGVPGEAVGLEGSFLIHLTGEFVGSSLLEAGESEGAIGPEGSCRDAGSSVGVRLRSWGLTVLVGCYGVGSSI